MFRLGSYVSVCNFGNWNVPVNCSSATTGGRRLNVTHKVGNVLVHIKTGRHGSSDHVFIQLTVPSNWSDTRVVNFIQNHFPKRKVNRTLVAAGVKFWDTKSKKQVALI